jgi:hypothetical protein
MDARQGFDEHAQGLKILIAECELAQAKGAGIGIPGGGLYRGSQKSSTLPSLAWRDGA